MQKREVGSHQGQEKEIWNVFSIFKYSKIRSLRKNNVFCFFFKGHLEPLVTWTGVDRSSYDRNFPF